MSAGWGNRVIAILGAAVISSATFFLAHVITAPQPVHPYHLSGAVLIPTTLVLVFLAPLFTSRARRTFDVLSLAIERIFLSIVAVGALGYFGVRHLTHPLGLGLAFVVLSIAIPAWIGWHQQRKRKESRTVVIGNDRSSIRSLLGVVEPPVVGFLSPQRIDLRTVDQQLMADGGRRVERLGGLSRIDEILGKYDIHAAILGFREPDRGEFFGTLDACYTHGVRARVHRGFSNSLPITQSDGELLVDIDTEPWGTVDYVTKRMFDVVFAATGLLVALPVVVLAALAIKFDDGGPILYRQVRTSVFGSTFEVYKFRTMREDAELDSGPRLSDEDSGGIDSRVTSIGRHLRSTHLDEIPQLWSILVGDMSVVGPRPERPELEESILRSDLAWKKRWFVSPGLTGLAQIHGATSDNPEQKLSLDLAYIRRRTFWLDLKIVIIQLWQVVRDVLEGMDEKRT